MVRKLETAKSRVHVVEQHTMEQLVRVVSLVIKIVDAARQWHMATFLCVLLVRKEWGSMRVRDANIDLH
jgi:hypothetical protein